MFKNVNTRRALLVLTVILVGTCIGLGSQYLLEILHLAILGSSVVLSGCVVGLTCGAFAAAVSWPLGPYRVRNGRATETHAGNAS
jgi:hypothetical protein